MKIRTRLAISAILPLGLFFIIVSMYVYTGRQVDHVRHKGETAAQIRRNVSDLSFIVQHRLLRHEIQRETPLNQVETTLATLISRQRSESPAESIILKRLRQDQQDINLLLSRLEMLWTQKGVKTTETVELENQLTAQVLERIREMASDAERLEKEATKEAAGAEKRANLIILGLTGFFSALALVISLSIMRRTSAALARIEEGTQIIGKGDMDHVIPIIADDELGHLSYAFNEMTGELRKSYAALQQEVIARSQSEEAVRRQAELIELSREAIIVKDLTGKILFWSNGAEETYGWTKTEALGKITHSLLKSRFPMPFDEYMAFLTRHGRWEGELIHTRKNGSELIVLSRHGLQNDEAGQAAAILEINFDITERKRAEIALQASEERWATTLASIGDAVISTDIAGKIMFMNAIAEAITGWTMTEALNKPISEIFRIMDEEKRREAENPVTKVFREGAIAGLATPTLLIKKDGTEIPIDHSGAPIRDKDGIAQGVVLVFRDITDRRRAEDNLRREIEERKKAEEHLRQSQKMEAIGTLAGGIAHDFNNVLAAILGFAEMAAENIANHPAEAMNNLQNVLKASLRARDLVKQILSFSRKTVEERSPIRLIPLIEETIQLLRASIPANVVIKFVVTATSDTVLAAPTEIQQILMNLATNASRAMEEKGGNLEISISDIDFLPGSPVIAQNVMPGEYVQLIVKDEGVGMSADVMKRVFEPFFTTRALGDGTGMGLAVVYGIVTDLQGTITVESEPGIGSTFRVFLPKIRLEAEEDDMTARQVATGTESVLFIDDEQMLVDWAQATLEKLGYRTIASTDPVESLKMFSTDPSRFDLVITDQSMPSMSGMQLAEKLFAIRPDIPIIISTGHSATISAETAKKSGIRQFIMKPVTKRELAHIVRTVLDDKK